MMNVIIDYDVGNLASVKKGFERAGIKTVISSDKATIQQAKALILPGVGAFKEAMKALKNTGLIPDIMAHIKAKKPLLGICLGMQLLYQGSEENGYTDGLGILDGIIKPLKGPLKVPHMGWNQLTFMDKTSLWLSHVKEGDYVYFVHSYYAEQLNDVIAYVDYGVKIPAIVAKDNVYGMQFHPEKSALVGLNLLKAFKEMMT